MSRISQCLDNARQRGRKLLVPYIVAGDPGIDVTVPVMHALVKAGADVIELGVPFSDPMAEGPTIQLAHERALVNGITLRKVLAMVTEFRNQDNNTPVVLMGYTNPIEHMGYEIFAQAAQSAGVDGVLLVDTPAEEANELHMALRHAGLDNIFLLAPTTVAQRISVTAKLATGYLYYVSLKGVTGAGNLDVEDVRKHIENIRLYTNLPVCVGFGIKDAESARAVAALADGVVVGSVLVQKMASLGASTATNTISAEVAKLVTELRQAIDSVQ